MGPEQQTAWKDEALNFVLAAIAQDVELRACLIFKGARVLSRRLPSMTRRSLDLDANLVGAVGATDEALLATADQLKGQLSQAIVHLAEGQEPVRYQLESVAVRPKPRERHPMGWQGFAVELRLQDLRRSGIKGLPTLHLDISAAEPLSAIAVEPLRIDGGSVLGYSVARQTAEKLRAFLQSSPAYRRKFQRPAEAVRAKDLADLALVLQERPATNGGFWDTVADEFVLACRARMVDCAGWTTFEDNAAVAAATYRGDRTLKGEATFEHAWDSLRTIVHELEIRRVFPFEFPLSGISQLAGA